MIIGLGIILYVIITGGLLIFAYLSAFGGGVSNSFNILLWILISPLLPVIGIVHLIGFIFCRLCYGKSWRQHEEELYEKKNRIIVVRKYVGLYEIEISNKKYELNIINYKDKNYACDDPDLLIKHLKDDTIKKYKGTYFILTSEELNEAIKKKKEEYLNEKERLRDPIKQKRRRITILEDLEGKVEDIKLKINEKNESRKITILRDSKLNRIKQILKNIFLNKK